MNSPIENHTNGMFEDEDSERSKISGMPPQYYCAHRIVSHAMAGFPSSAMEKYLKKVVDELYGEILNVVECHLWSDAEINLQSKMRQTIDNIVSGLLGGSEWSLKEYVFTDKYKGEDIRKAIAAHIPNEICAARIRDLENKIKKLEEDVQYYRNRIA